MDKEIKKVTFYRCPVCGISSDNLKEVQEHLRAHTIKAEEWYYCRACGAGWSVSAYGPDQAAELARECYQKHIDEGNLTETAAETFFLSGGTFGWTKN